MSAGSGGAGTGGSKVSDQGGEPEGPPSKLWDSRELPDDTGAFVILVIGFLTCKPCPPL